MHAKYMQTVCKKFAKIMQKVFKNYAKRIVMHCTLIYTWTILGTWHLALCTWHSALGTWHLALGTWHLAMPPDLIPWPSTSAEETSLGIFQLAGHFNQPTINQQDNHLISSVPTCCCRSQGSNSRFQNNANS